MAAVVLLACAGRGALGAPGSSLTLHASEEVEELRELCNQQVLHRVEGQAPPPEEQHLAESAFVELLQISLDQEDDFMDCPELELVAWFRGCLARDPSDRFGGAGVALEALDDAWSELEGRMLKEALAARQAGEPARDDEEPPGRLVFTPPPELANMTLV